MSKREKVNIEELFREAGELINESQYIDHKASKLIKTLKDLNFSEEEDEQIEDVFGCTVASIIDELEMIIY